MISILLPTRDRVKACEHSLRSLFEKAHNSEQLELLLGIDSDDTHSAEYFSSKQFNDLIKQHGVTVKTHTYQRKGYLNLNEYVNDLATHATGEWLMFWNDDAEMLTEHWDTHIHSKTWFGCLRMPCKNFSHPFALFPIIPAKWLQVFGTVSPVNHSDWWIYNVCKSLNRVRDIPVDVLHNRADINGENSDQTFSEQSYALDGKSPHDMRDYSHPQRRLELNQWRQKLMLYGYPHINE